MAFMYADNVISPMAKAFGLQDIVLDADKNFYIIRFEFEIPNTGIIKKRISTAAINYDT